MRNQAVWRTLSEGKQNPYPSADGEKMKRLAIAATILAGTSAFGGPCPDWPNTGDLPYTYNLQSAAQIIRTGPITSFASNSTAKNLSADLSNLDTLVYSRFTRYKIPLNFTPNCTNTSSPASATVRLKDSLDGAQFSTVSSTYPRVQYYDSMSPGLNGHPEYLEWMSFNFIDVSSTVYAYLGRIRNQGPSFSNWMGVAYLADSVRGPTGWYLNGIRFYSLLAGPMDSAALDTYLTAGPTGWIATMPWDGNHHPWVYEQMIKVVYDTAASPLPINRHLTHSKSTFSAWQQGRMVWIHAGRDLTARGEAVELYDMFGRKTADLHPSGYLYGWNGKSLSGDDASSGLYFARSGSRILGKFVYGR